MARALWKGSISFGLVNIPIELHTAVRNHRPKFRMLHRSEEHTSELQSHRDLHSFPTRRSSDLARALWKGSISFGLVNIPIELHTAVRNHRPKFRMLH